MSNKRNRIGDLDRLDAVLKIVGVFVSLMTAAASVVSVIANTFELVTAVLVLLVSIFLLWWLIRLTWPARFESGKSPDRDSNQEGTGSVMKASPTEPALPTEPVLPTEPLLPTEPPPTFTFTAEEFLDDEEGSAESDTDLLGFKPLFPTGKDGEEGPSGANKD